MNNRIKYIDRGVKSEREFTEEDEGIYRLIIQNTHLAENVKVSHMAVVNGKHELRYVTVEIDNLIDSIKEYVRSNK